MPFQTQIQIYLSDTDAAGILFYPNLFRKCQNVLELYLSDRGVNLKDLFEEGTGFPIVHSESDYQSPLCLGDQIDVMMSVFRLGRRSLTLEYQFSKSSEKVASAKVTHVYLERANFKAVEWPDHWRKFWEALI